MGKDGYLKQAQTFPKTLWNVWCSVYDRPILLLSPQMPLVPMRTDTGSLFVRFHTLNNLHNQLPTTALLTHDGMFATELNMFKKIWQPTIMYFFSILWFRFYRCKEPSKEATKIVGRAKTKSEPSHWLQTFPQQHCAWYVTRLCQRCVIMAASTSWLHLARACKQLRWHTSAKHEATTDKHKQLGQLVCIHHEVKINAKNEGTVKNKRSDRAPTHNQVYLPQTNPSKTRSPNQPASKVTVHMAKIFFKSRASMSR